MAFALSLGVLSGAPVAAHTDEPLEFTPPSLIESNEPDTGNYQDFEVGDFNADGIPDVVFTKHSWQTQERFPIRLLLGDGRGGFSDGSSLFVGPLPETEQSRQLLIEDFNGDGRDDIYIADTGMDTFPWPGYQDTLVLSTPDGKLVDATENLPGDEGYTHSAAAGDVDGDEDIDIFAGHWGVEWYPGDPDAEPPEILINDGTGHFTPGFKLPDEVTRVPPGASGNAVARALFVDANDDGSQDLILGSHDSNPNLVLLNDGFGRFTVLANALPAKAYGTDAVTTEISSLDVNRDGIADLLWAFTQGDPYYVGRHIQVLIGNGDGTFRDETSTRLDVQSDRYTWLYDIRITDIDVDGHLDFAVSPFAGGDEPVDLYLDNGSGVYERQRPAGAIAQILHLLDVNGDSHPDLFETRGPSQSTLGGVLVQLQIVDEPIERRVTLTLKGHLTAKGSVSIPGGGPPMCLSNVEVRVEIKKGTRWALVKKTKPSASGSYRVALADRSDSYRARVGQMRTQDGANVCAAARSRIARHEHG